MVYNKKHWFLGPYLFEEEDKAVTTNAERCRKFIEEFYDDLNASITPGQLCRTWFMQNVAPPHTEQNTIAHLHQLFNIVIIALTTDYKWAAHSSDLNRLDF